jgi:hypothetical protein
MRVPLNLRSEVSDSGQLPLPGNTGEPAEKRFNRRFLEKPQMQGSAREQRHTAFLAAPQHCW